MREFSNPGLLKLFAKCVVRLKGSYLAADVLYIHRLKSKRSQIPDSCSWAEKSPHATRYKVEEHELQHVLQLEKFSESGFVNFKEGSVCEGPIFGSPLLGESCNIIEL